MINHISCRPSSQSVELSDAQAPHAASFQFCALGKRAGSAVRDSIATADDSASPVLIGGSTLIGERTSTAALNAESTNASRVDCRVYPLERVTCKEGWGNSLLLASCAPSSKH